jgi:hypothetical protein
MRIAKLFIVAPASRGSNSASRRIAAARVSRTLVTKAVARRTTPETNRRRRVLHDHFQTALPPCMKSKTFMSIADEAGGFTNRRNGCKR